MNLVRLIDFLRDRLKAIMVVGAVVPDLVEGYLYREPIERIQGVVGAIFILVSVLWLPTVYLFDIGLR